MLPCLTMIITIDGTIYSVISNSNCLTLLLWLNGKAIGLKKGLLLFKKKKTFLQLEGDGNMFFF